MEQKIRELRISMNTRLSYFIGKYINDRDDVEDIIQEVFLKVLENADSIQNVSKLENWIFQVTRNLINDYYRKKNKSDIVDFCDDCMPGNRQPKQVFRTSTLNYVNELVENLPEEQKDIILKVEFGGIKLIEYAESKGISYSSAKSRIQRARLRIKTQLLECCHFEIDKNGNVLDYWERKEKK